MTRLIAMIAVIGIAAAGCKKNTAPEAPAADAPAKQTEAVAWTWGPATFAGSRAEGNSGTLTIPVKATNQSGSGMVLKVLDLNVRDGDDRVCGAKSSFNEKASPGKDVSASLELSCEYRKIPAGDLTVRGTAIYEIGGERKQDRVNATVAFSR